MKDDYKLSENYEHLRRGGMLEKKEKSSEYLRLIGVHLPAF